MDGMDGRTDGPTNRQTQPLVEEKAAITGNPFMLHISYLCVDEHQKDFFYSQNYVFQLYSSSDENKFARLSVRSR